MAIVKTVGKPRDGMSFRRANFTGAFWRGIGYRAARAAWATSAFLGAVFVVLIGIAWWGHHLHKVVHH